MTVAETLARVKAAGVHLRLEAGRLLASPRERLTDELRELIRVNKAAILAALAHAEQPEHAHAHGAPDVQPRLALSSAPDRGTDCMRCSHLTMRCEHHLGTRRIFWWRCAKHHEILEARNFGERVLLAPPECAAAGDFAQWQPGQR